MHLKSKIFDIETYKDCKLIAENHRREFICPMPKGDKFIFRIDIGATSMKPEFECLYYNKDGQGTVLYRAEPNNHIHEFWIELGNLYFKQTSGDQDKIREKVLKEYNFNWKGEGIDY